MSEFAKSLMKDVVIAGVLAIVILQFVRPTIVKETSMQDTLNENDYVMLSKRAYVNEDPQRGDIIVFQSGISDEDGNQKLLIKRVIGLPGDTITIKDDQLYINGEKYDETYLKDGITTGDIENLEVPDNEYFVMGDNRVVSIDSRYSEVGFVDRDTIIGKAVLRLYPFNEIRTF